MLPARLAMPARAVPNLAVPNLAVIDPVIDDLAVPDLAVTELAVPDSTVPGAEPRPAIDRMPAGEPVVHAVSGERRLALAALAGGMRASRGEPAAGRRLRQVGREPGYVQQPLPVVLAQPRDGTE